MKEITIQLNDFFNNDFRFHSKEEIIKKLNLKGEEDEKLLNATLRVFVEEGILFNENDLYKKFPINKGYAFGKIQINKSGTGFIHTKDGYTILVDNHNLNGALDGDSVIATNIFNKRHDYYDGEVYKVVKRKKESIIFQVVGNGKYASLVPYSQNEFINIDINPNELNKLIDGDLVKVNISTESFEGVYFGNIVEIVGNKNDIDADIKVIASKYNVQTSFTDEVVEEILNIPEEVRPCDIEGRVDLRSENIFTIDCDQTKDRDDAVGIKILENGNFLLKVSIAHVSHYIKPGMKTFDDAINRGFSHYLLSYVINMLHPKISNGICSLNPNVDRLTRTVEMEINSEGEIVNYNIYDSVINSKKAMSYSKCNSLFNGDIIDDYEPYRNDLLNMLKLYKIMENVRQKKNYLDFGLIEIKEKEDEHRNINGFEKNDYGICGKIIEVFMGLANSIVYSNYSWLTLPFRVHEEPDEEKVQDLLKVLRQSGFKIPKYNNIDCKALNTILGSLNSTEADVIAREHLLRTMNRAKYSTDNIGHYATRYDCYGHFTSPIRRAPDLITNALIDNYEKFDYDPESIEYMQNAMNNVCEKINRLEKISEEMEAESLEMAMAEYMEDKIGNEYEAYITDLGLHSLFARTTEYITGRVRYDDIESDQYHFDVQKHILIGRNGTIYRIGDKINVVVKSASKGNRTIDFSIPKQKKLIR